MNANHTRPILLKVLTIVLLFSLLTAILPACSLPKPVIYPTPNWSTSTPEEQGFDSANLANGLLAIKEKKYNIHSLLVVRNGSIVVDANFYPYDGKTPHRLASVTKSVMTTLIAIAADQGKLKLDQPMLDFFTDRNVQNIDALKKKITVRHLTGMASGLDSVGLAQDEGTLAEMVASKDFIQFAIDRKVIYEPGTRFIYDSPSTHILSAILQEATGQTTEQFAKKNLFEPLGIQEWYWETDPQGYTHGWSDLYLKPPDVARIGYLFLNRGKWGDKQIVSSAWVDASTKTQQKTGLNDDYGFGWWVTEENPHEYAAQGRGGQRIQVYPDLNALIVVTAAGVEYDNIIAEIAPSLVDRSKPLKGNPDGVAKFNAAVQTLVQTPAAAPYAALPPVAKQISGKVISCQPNPFQVKTVKLGFSDNPEVSMDMTFFNSQAPQSVKIGLDGIYRMFVENHLTRGYRGQWIDPTTFVFEYYDITRGEVYTISVKFDGQKVFLEGREPSHEAVAKFEGMIQ